MKKLADFTLTELSKLSTKDLLAVYNASAPEPTKRFADHTSGFQRTKKLWSALQVKAPKPISQIDPTLQHKKARCKVLVAPLSKPSDAKEYHSVLAAFKALNLPIEKHQRFRRQVKLNGKASIAQYVFTATY